MRLREFLSQTQAEFAGTMGLAGADSVLRIENGQARMISIDAIERLLAALEKRGMTFEEWLIGRPRTDGASADDLFRALAKAIAKRDFLGRPAARDLTADEMHVYNSLSAIIIEQALDRGTSEVPPVIRAIVDAANKRKR